MMLVIKDQWAFLLYSAGKLQQTFNTSGQQVSNQVGLLLCCIYPESAYCLPMQSSITGILRIFLGCVEEFWTEHPIKLVQKHNLASSSV